MNLKPFALPALAIFLGTTSLATFAMPAASPAPGIAQDRDGWDAPPREFRDIQRRGFHDGIEGARRDVENHRRPDVNNRDEFRNAGGPPEVRDAYREGFRRGYDTAIAHLMGAQPAPPPPPIVREMHEIERAWDAPPAEFREHQQRGYHDGIEAARRDFDLRRAPAPAAHDEFRHPGVPRDLQDEYRDAFRRGYERAMTHLRGDPDRR
jgi:hypothetical protein